MAEVLYPQIKIKSNQLSWLRWIFTLACQTSLMHPCQARAPTRVRLYQKICPGPDHVTGGIDHHQSYFYPHYTIAFNLQGVQKSRLTWWTRRCGSCRSCGRGSWPSRTAATAFSTRCSLASDAFSIEPDPVIRGSGLLFEGGNTGSECLCIFCILCIFCNPSDFCTTRHSNIRTSRKYKSCCPPKFVRNEFKFKFRFLPKLSTSWREVKCWLPT